jgi:hypothetical protein
MQRAPHLRTVGTAILAASLAGGCAARRLNPPIAARPPSHEGPQADYSRLGAELSVPSKRAEAAERLRNAALEGKDISGTFPALISSLAYPECRYSSAWALGNSARTYPSVIVRLADALGKSESREGAGMALWVASTHGVDVSLALIPAGKALGNEESRSLMAEIFRTLSLRSEDISSALPNLRIALRHDDSRKAAAEAVWLASLNHDISDFLPELREALKHDDSRASSIRALSNMAGKGKYVLTAIPEMVECLSHSDSRYHAVKIFRVLALKGIDISAAVEPLARALNDPSCRKLAASALWFAAENGTDISGAVDALSACLEHDSCRAPAGKALAAASRGAQSGHAIENPETGVPENPF